MFDNLSERLRESLKRVRGQARLTEENIQEALRDVRRALLEADVALPVVREFIEQVRERAIGREVLSSLNPGQVLVKVVQDELIHVMGEANEALNLRTQPPAVVMLAGLQGSGKTTSAAKLARLLKERQKKSVMLVSCDVYRPAAIDQLKTLATQVDVAFFPSQADQKPVEIATSALASARQNGVDVLIVDTAGRLAIDEEMMEEARQLHTAVEPIETLFVVDSMTGQDAATTAKAFDDALALTGVVLTKTDGDARGGAALSIRKITGKPIKFLGIGEKTDALELFHPERLASRILGQGDVLSLVEEVERKIDKDKAAKLANKVSKGKGFTLQDYRDQLEQMMNLGDLEALMEKVPGMAEIPKEMKDQIADGKKIKYSVAIINSMTPHERRFPNLIKGSRKRRIANGSGTDIQRVNRLLKEFSRTQKVMKKMKGGGMAKMMRGLSQRFQGGGMPPMR